MELVLKSRMRLSCSEVSLLAVPDRWPRCSKKEEDVVKVSFKYETRSQVRSCCSHMRTKRLHLSLQMKLKNRAEYCGLDAADCD